MHLAGFQEPFGGLLGWEALHLGIKLLLGGLYELRRIPFETF